MLLGIIGFGKACELAKNNLDNHIKYVKGLRDYYFSEIQKNINNIKINGSIIDRLPGNANVSFRGVNAQELLFKLDSKGICASSGSACSSGENTPSYVLTAIGLDSNLANGVLRVTLGDFNNKEEVDYLVRCLKEFVTVH